MMLKSIFAGTNSTFGFCVKLDIFFKELNMCKLGMKLRFDLFGKF